MDSEKATAVSPPAHPCVRAAQAGVSHNQKTIKSRRKEKRRRRTNSLSLRRRG